MLYHELPGNRPVDFNLQALATRSFRIQRAMLAHQPPCVLRMRVKPSSQDWGSQTDKNSIKKTLSLNQTS
jgi:hypothetical protein